MCSTAFVAKTVPSALCVPLPSWLRQCLFLVCSTTFVAKALPSALCVPLPSWLRHRLSLRPSGVDVLRKARAALKKTPLKKSPPPEPPPLMADRLDVRVRRSAGCPPCVLRWSACAVDCGGSSGHPRGRFGHSTSQFGDALLVYGGNDGTGATNEILVLQFNDASGAAEAGPECCFEWHPVYTTGSALPREGHTATNVGNCICIWAGRKEEGGSGAAHPLTAAPCIVPHNMDHHPTMTLITSDCGATRSLSIKWPYSPRVVSAGFGGSVCTGLCDDLLALDMDLLPRSGPQIEADQLELLNRIGVGAFGEVFKGKISRRRDCRSAALPSPFSRRFNRDDEGMSAK